MIEFISQLSTESKMIATLAILFVVSVAWSNKDKIVKLVPNINRSVDSRPGPHELLDSYLMLVDKAKADDDPLAKRSLTDCCHIVFKPYEEAK